MKGPLDRKFRFPQVLTIFVALGGIQSTPAAPGDGTVHLFKCGKGGGYQVEFKTARDISTYGFGNSDRAILVVNADNYDAEAGGLITNIRQPPKGSRFALLQVIVKVPEISQVVTIDVCFQTPHGKKVVELPFHKFHRQKLDHGWVTAAAAAGAFALPNDGESCVVQSIRMRLTGTGNIYFGKVVVGYSNKNFVLPEDIAAKTQICPKICEATE